MPAREIISLMVHFVMFVMFLMVCDVVCMIGIPNWVCRRVFCYVCLWVEISVYG